LNYLFKIILSSSLIFVLAGCRANQASTSWFSLDALVEKLAGSKIQANQFYDVHLTTPENSEISSLAKISATSCKISKRIGKPKNITWQLKMDSAFGEMIIHLSHAYKNKKNQYQVEVDQQRFTLKVVGTNFSQKLIDDICAEVPADGNTIKLTHSSEQKAQVESHFAEILKALAPDCQIQFNPALSSWSCSLEGLDPKVAEQEIAQMRSTIIRRWSRLPYILTRRLSMAHLLAKIYQEPKATPKLTNFCQILETSLFEELPLAFTSRTWQESVCSSQDQNQRERAIQIGLNKALTEIEQLRQLYERSSRLGLLTLRLPKELEKPTRDFLISLIPETNVTEELAKVSANIWIENLKESASSPTPNSSMTSGCWHPLFSKNYPQLILAKQLDLVGSTSTSSCTDTTDNSGAIFVNPHVYLADSVTSETEFTLSNRHSILLRLPSGSYKVLVHQLIPMEGDEEDSLHFVGRSVIKWQNKRPRVVVNSIKTSTRATK
jgi:hypothetical protein